MSVRSTLLAAAATVAWTLTATASAAPFGGAAEVATPSIPNTNFVQLKQISGFTGQLPLSLSDGAYAPVGSSFNKLASFRLGVACPAGHHVHQAGYRVRGADVQNLNIEIVSPGDLPSTQGTWQQTFEIEPWEFDAVVATGGAALAAVGNNGPVHVSLEDELDSRIEFYGWCADNDPLSDGVMYYDSTQDGGDLRPKTRVRYTLRHAVAAPALGALRLAPAAQPTHAAVPLRQRDGAVKMVPALKAPGGCPYDCPPPEPRRLRLTK